MSEKTILDTVLDYYGRYSMEDFTKQDVLCAIQKELLTPRDLAALLSPAGLECLEQMARRAKQVTARQFGNAVTLFTPLYIANFCVNHCVYCGFNCTNQINRAKLTLPEMEQEFQAIARTGLKEILILTGESRAQSDVEYIGQSIELAKNFFSTIGIEVYPMDVEDYAYLQKKGADFVSVYQETYNREKYAQVHLSGPKRDFAYRFNAQERALQGGMRGVSVGALLGLDDFRQDAFSAALHARLLQQRYPKAEISFSVPRMRPYKNNESNSPHDVHEPQLLQVMLAYRLFMPFAGICISSRERAGFRDHVVGLAATKISAGVSTGVGGHEKDAKGDEQFEISDPRSVDEISKMLLDRGMQPLFTDYIRM